MDFETSDATLLNFLVNTMILGRLEVFLTACYFDEGILVLKWLKTSSTAFHDRKLYMWYWVI